MQHEFRSGFWMLARGLSAWRTHTGLMFLGLVPAVITGVLLLGLLIPLAFALGPFTEWITPFADGWDPLWQNVLRIGAWIALFAAALVLSAALFTALALVIGDPFYQRIVRGIQQSLTGDDPVAELPFWDSVRDGIRLGFLGLLYSIVALLIGLIPVVGGPGGFIVNVLLSGKLIATELLGRALSARGYASDAQRALLREHSRRVRGFGVATQLCFLIPLGAIFMMPAAVAGATMLAQDLTDLGVGADA